MPLASLTDIVQRLSPGTGGVWIFLAAFFGTLLLSGGVAAFLLVRAPADYFAGARPPPLPGPPWLRLLLKLLKNLVGLALVGVGILLSLPGVPGQGLLTVLVGLMLIDGPGKRRLEVWIIGLPGVHRAADALRRKFGRPPLRVQPHAGTKKPEELAGSSGDTPTGI